nr:ribonuclease J [Lachnospiraceae bacterium]
LDIEKSNIFIMHSGQVLEFANAEANLVGEVECGSVLVDGLGVGDVGNMVLRDRQKLADEGIVIVVLALDAYSGQVIAKPQISTRGFVYVKQSEDVLEETCCVVEETIGYCQNKGITDWGRLKGNIKDALSEFIWHKTKRKPMILPIIVEINL